MMTLSLTEKLEQRAMQQYTLDRVEDVMRTIKPVAGQHRALKAVEVVLNEPGTDFEILIELLQRLHVKVISGHN